MTIGDRPPKWSCPSCRFNNFHPFFMGAPIYSNVIGLAKPFHRTKQCGELIRSKIVVQRGSMVPFLFKINEVLIGFILRKKAACTTAFLMGLIGNELARTQQFISFVITGTDCNLQYFHLLAHICRTHLRTLSRKVRCIILFIAKSVPLLVSNRII